MQGFRSAEVITKEDEGGEEEGSQGAVEEAGPDHSLRRVKTHQYYSSLEDSRMPHCHSSLDDRSIVHHDLR